MTELWIIAAVSENRVIGNKSSLPWRIPQDLSRFKALTLGHTLLMGRKTFESIGAPLPGRNTLVLTRSSEYAAPGVIVAHDPEQALALVAGPRAFVAGGADIYRLFLPRASKLFLTRVHGVYEGDTLFPAFDPGDWELRSEERGSPALPETPAYTFQIYERKDSV